MPRIKFIRNTTEKEAGPQPPRSGDVIDVDDASAQRWVRRQAAEIIPATEPATKPSKKKGDE